jgi:hypothetical protein
MLLESFDGIQMHVFYKASVTYISVGIECSGPIPVGYSMLSLGACARTTMIIHSIPISISFLTVLSNQIISHIQVETFCSEIFTYFLPEICK